MFYITKVTVFTPSRHSVPCLAPLGPTPTAILIYNQKEILLDIPLQ